MVKAFKDVLSESLKRKINMSKAAHVVAVAHVAEAMRLCG